MKKLQKILAILFCLVLVVSPSITYADDETTTTTTEIVESTTQESTTETEETTEITTTSTTAKAEVSTTNEVDISDEEAEKLYKVEEYKEIEESTDFIDNSEDIEDIEKEIKETEALIKKTEKEISEYKKNVQKATSRRERYFKAYGEIMRLNYINGNASVIEVLLTCKDIETLFTRLEMIRSVSKSSQAALEKLLEAEDSKQKQEEQLEMKNNALESQKKLLESGKQALEAMNGLSQGTGTLLTAKDIKKMAAADTQYIATDGKFSYPTKYRKISGGFPNYSSGGYHGGLDFPCPIGTKVHASADGIVVLTREMTTSYGYYIIIDHGNGLATLYAHNSEILVKAGDEIKRGDVIALSGSTGNSTGPHCHFEVRVNGVRVDPNIYLKTSKKSKKMKY